ncbi:hypothetical protein NEUTE2DRAFT_90990 [Neurospora tetrasperma FGSC 2509]|nr:hypothetical protein NEUTE2DRAFT_90990 [Neurospora tetrasperma FGSC 2509]
MSRLLKLNLKPNHPVQGKENQENDEQATQPGPHIESERQSRARHRREYIKKYCREKRALQRQQKQEQEQNEQAAQAESQFERSKSQGQT